MSVKTLGYWKKKPILNVRKFVYDMQVNKIEVKNIQVLKIWLELCIKQNHKRHQISNQRKFSWIENYYLV